MLGITNTRGHYSTQSSFEHHRFWYCGTCKCLHRRYGLWSRLLLNFDLVLLGELLTAHHPSATHVYNNGLCFLLPNSSEFSPLHRLITDLHLVFLHLKRLDAERDGDHRLIQRFARLKKSTIQRALDNLALQGLPHQLWNDYLQTQWKLESMVLPVIEYAKPTEMLCRTIVRAAGELAQTPLEASFLDQLGQAFGRWIYLADAFKDLEDDQRRKRFNAFTHSTQHITDKHHALPLVQKAQNELATIIRAMHFNPQTEQYFLKRLDFTSQYNPNPTASCNSSLSPAPASLHSTKHLQALSLAASIALLFTASWQLHAAYITLVVQDGPNLAHQPTNWISLLPWMLSLWLAANLYASWKYRHTMRRLWSEWKAGVMSLLQRNTDEKNEEAEKNRLHRLIHFLVLLIASISGIFVFFSVLVFFTCFFFNFCSLFVEETTTSRQTPKEDYESYCKCCTGLCVATAKPYSRC